MIPGKKFQFVDFIQTLLSMSLSSHRKIKGALLLLTVTVCQFFSSRASLLSIIIFLLSMMEEQYGTHSGQQ